MCTEDQLHMESKLTPSLHTEQTHTGKRYALEGRNITKNFAFGQGMLPILKGISLTVEHGELLAIVGPSGSGKSTLLGILAGLDTPTGGQVFIDGADITHMKEGQLAAGRNAKIGMVYQG